MYYAKGIYLGTFLEYEMSHISLERNSLCGPPKKLTSIFRHEVCSLDRLDVCESSFKMSPRLLWLRWDYSINWDLKKKQIQKLWCFWGKIFNVIWYGFHKDRLWHLGKYRGTELFLNFLVQKTAELLLNSLQEAIVIKGLETFGTLIGAICSE